MIKIELLRIIYGKTTSKNNLQSYKLDLHYITNYDKVVCTLQDSIEFCNIKSINKFGKEYLKWPTLLELHQKLFDTTPNNLHNSLIDILVTLRCFMKLKYDHDILENCSMYKKYSNEFNLI